MSKIDAASLMDDFVSEARIHAAKIESAFLDIDRLSKDSSLMDSVFRAAHSLKGTAGFFSLEKIVSVAHELESVFSQIKDGNLEITEEIADIALLSTDCLNDLLDNIHSPEAVDTDEVLAKLSLYSVPKEVKKEVKPIKTPFNITDEDTLNILRGAVKKGHWMYYIHPNFDKSLGWYYARPQKLADDIISIGEIMEALINGVKTDVSAFGTEVKKKISEGSAVSADLLVTSILEPELFQMAVELDGRYIHPLSKDLLKGAEGPVKKPKANPDKALPKAPLSAELHKVKEDFSIRLDVSIVNRLLDLANEMILTRNQLLSLISHYSKDVTGLIPILQNMERLTSEIQENAMRTRMQPISEIFDKFPRIIRDMGKTLNKDIKVDIVGGDVALDKYLLESLSDPITQIVKNSADHGIEDSEKRALSGKPQKGTITLKAYIHDGSAVIEVIDDGAGMDVEAIKNKAVERGLVSEAVVQFMPENVLFSLIFEPGFSTAKEVTNLSGRGVGMDIVKANIEKLGGSVEVESVRGQGTSIRLRTPLTMSVIRALLIIIDDIQYAVPEINVERIVRIKGSEGGKRIERVSDTLVLNLDGWIMPIVTLPDIAAVSSHQPLPSIEPVYEKCLRGDIIKCLVLKAGKMYYALLIDDASQTEETLVKPLPIYLRNCRAYSYVTVLGNGKTLMIMDVEGILSLMGIGGVEALMDYDFGQSAEPENLRRILIFKCSGKEYYALNISDIARVDRFDASDIQEIGGYSFINIGEKSIKIVRPESFAPVSNSEYSKPKLCLISLKGSCAQFGLLAGRIVSSEEGLFNVDNSIVEGKYIEGSAVFKEKILIFLNAAAICEAMLRND